MYMYSFHHVDEKMALKFNPLSAVYLQGNRQVLPRGAEPQCGHWLHYQQAPPSSHQHRTVWTNIPGQESRDGTASQVGAASARSRLQATQSEHLRKERQHCPNVPIREVRFHIYQID